MTNGNQSKKPTSGPKGEAGPNRGGWSTERRGKRKGKKKGMQTRRREEQGEFQPFKLLKILDKLFRNRQALPV